MNKATLRKYLGIVPQYIVFLTALLATMGSLYYSEVQKLEPCKFCWYQRICWYPIVVIMLVASIRKDTKVYMYTAPLALVGWGLALYHYLLQKTNLFPKEVGCSPTAPCSGIDLEYFGFITIPFMSLVGFTIILACNYLMRRFGVKYE